MRLLHLLAAALLAVTAGSQTVADGSATLPTAALGERFLLQISYEEPTAHQDFRTSRSRVVRFQREGDHLRMIDVSDTRVESAAPVLAIVPIRRETSSAVVIDLNAGFDAVASEEDRTGEDYYGRIGRHDDSGLRLVERQVVSISRHGATLVFDQAAKTDDGQRIVVHYYLSPYRPSPDFRPFEMENLRRFGFYETYPQWRDGRWVLYAMKFGVHEPIVFALSSAIPQARRAAVRDGVSYWNRALGRSLIKVIDAPRDVRAPSPDYNVIQWAMSGDYESTSYIQSDPLTGQILHAHVFVLPETMMEGDLEEQNDHLRYIVAHEIGHALGLRHNFAPGAATTVMNYFKLPEMLQIGRDIRTGAAALPYDRAVMRHVYLEVPLDLDMLPAFCTDSQPGCVPFRSLPKETEGMRGNAESAKPDPKH